MTTAIGRAITAVSSVVLGKDAGEGGAGFLGAVFVVAGEEDDVLAEAGACGAFVNDGSRVDLSDCEDGGEEWGDLFHFV